jgi:beta propeller domain-containing protein
MVQGGTLVALALLLALAFGGPGAASGKHKKPRHKHKQHHSLAQSARIAPFGSCQALSSFAEAKAGGYEGGRYRPEYSPDGYSGPVVNGTAGGSLKKSEDAPAAPGAGGDFSTTNVQEQGVDEPDIVKTDGKTIFAVAGGRLNALDARATPPRVIGSIPLEGSSNQMLLADGRVLVIGQDTELPPDVDPAPDPSDPAPKTKAPPGIKTLEEQTAVITEIDVSNPAAMKVTATQRLAGAFVDARQSGGSARIVISSPDAAGNVPVSKLTAGSDGWIRLSHFHSNATGADVTSPVIDDCNEVGRPAKFSGFGLLTVLTVDLGAGLPAVDADAVMTDGATVYASAQSLYVSSGGWSAEAIHKFDISDPVKTTYAASGAVRGTILNQFSMSEWNGNLRVASTAFQHGEDVSRLTVLGQNGTDLPRIGQVGNIGRGEEAKAVRLIGDRGYVVTFRNLDPLFTLDLSNPASPRVVGKLEIPGYSAYLHPIGEDRLLGVGADADENGFTKGAQISLFDVSNLRDPKRLARKTVPGGRSAIEDTHHAFLYWAPQQLAVVPVEGVREFKGKTRNAALGFRIGRSNIGQIGKIAHRARSKRGEPIDRSVVVGDRLFTFSCGGAGVNALSDLRPQAWLPFPGADPRRCQTLIPPFVVF